MPYTTKIISAILSATLLLTGCSTSMLIDRPADEVLSKFDSRLVRGRVDMALTPENQALWIDSLSDKELEMVGLSVYTREQLKSDFRFVTIRYQSFFNQDDSYPLLAHNDLNLGFHDIVEGYTGKIDEQPFRDGKTYSVPLFVKVGALEGAQFQSGTYKKVPQISPAVILGVVCRAADDGCSINSSPETQIGLGRKMSGPEDYRGVAAESKQEIGLVEFPEEDVMPC